MQCNELGLEGRNGRLVLLSLSTYSDSCYVFEAYVCPRLCAGEIAGKVKGNTFVVGNIASGFGILFWAIGWMDGWMDGWDGGIGRIVFSWMRTNYLWYE